MLLPTRPSATVPARRFHRLESRDGGQPIRNRMVYIVLIAIIGSIILIGVIAVWLRSLRARHSNPKLLPTAYLKNKWRNWRVPSYSRGAYQTANGNDGSYDPGVVIHIETARDSEAPMTSGSRCRVARVRSGTGASPGSGTGGNTGTVDRNTSVRSVMTLPAYKLEAREGEQVIGREGERDGVDVVLEMRTAEEEEELRNAEMEQLYHIRQLRRTWNAQRETRRERRRDARARGDVIELERLREEARQARDNSELDELRRELEDIKSKRDTHVSVVSYADVGVARHDGTRVRASSIGATQDGSSEQVGLLSDAESMAQASPGLGGGGGGGRNRASSLLTWSTGFGHRRGRSNSSVLSVDTDAPSFGVARSRANSRADSRTSREASPNLGGANSRRGSDAVMEVDLGDEAMPPHSPPSYDRAEMERSGSNTPVPVPDEAPPGYVSRGPSLSHGHGGQSQAQAGLGITMNDDDHRQEQRSSRGVGGVPQLPSLRLARLPQIVVEPSRPDA